LLTNTRLGTFLQEQKYAYFHHERGSPAEKFGGDAGTLGIEAL
jgi:hypothetical protein